MSQLSVAPGRRTGTSPLREPPRRYADLKRSIERAGLLDRQPLYYSGKTTLLFGLMAVSILMLFLSRSVPFQLLNAAFSAFVWAQLGLLGHDAGHNQVFGSTRWNTLLGRLCGNLAMGLGLQWWKDHHNAHHAKPNQEGFDPDADIPLLAFTPEQAARRSGFARWCVAHQSPLLPVMAAFQLLDLKSRTITFLLGQRTRGAYAESSLVVIHLALYGIVLFLTQGLVMGLLFAVVQHVLAGLYLAAIFAPNHTGMPVLTKDQRMDFLHQQVMTARNVRVPRFLAFLFGGLHLQIEHHLFPTMPRNNLRRARPIVQAFCQAQGIAYRETAVARTYLDIFQHMWRISRMMTLGQIRPQRGAL